MSLSKARCHAKTAILAYLFSKCGLAHLSLLSWRRPKRRSDSELVEESEKEKLIKLKI